MPRRQGQSAWRARVRAVWRAVPRPRQPVLVALRELSGLQVDWRRETYGFVSDRLAIGLLFGSERERLGLGAGRGPREIASAWELEEAAFRQQRAEFLLYS